VEAAQDGGKAVELDPGNAKAYLRKGCVLMFLIELRAAMMMVVVAATMRARARHGARRTAPFCERGTVQHAPPPPAP
jgi:hypothetical protein